MRHTITLAAASSNLKGNFTEWTNYFLGTGFGAFAKNVLGLASGVVTIFFLIGIVTRLLGRSNWFSRTFCPGLLVAIAWTVAVLIASAPATGGMILAPIDKGVDFLTGIAENKL